jgi:hypothetical protein
MVLRKIENKSFIRSSEGAIASYSYEDIVDGSGIIVFYLSQTRTATATAYSLIQVLQII